MASITVRVRLQTRHLTVDVRYDQDQDKADPEPHPLWQMRSKEEAADFWHKEFGHLSNPAANAPKKAGPTLSSREPATCRREDTDPGNPPGSKPGAATLP